MFKTVLFITHLNRHKHKVKIAIYRLVRVVSGWGCISLIPLLRNGITWMFRPSSYSFFVHPGFQCLEDML